MTRTGVRSAIAGAVAAGALGAGAAPALAQDPVTVDRCTGNAQVTCLAPQTLRAAYGVRPLLQSGLTGAGPVVVLPETATPAGTHTGISLTQSLVEFDRRYGLAGVRLAYDTSMAPGADPDIAASKEEVLDAEMVHTFAPGAIIRVQLLPPTVPSHLPDALQADASTADIVSISYGVSERCADPSLAGALAAALRNDRDQHVTVLASAGDNGAAARSCPGHPATDRGVGLPAAEPLVTAVGGTQLTADPSTGAYGGEVVWDRPQADPANPEFNGTGGGFSSLFARPAYQDGATSDPRRGVPDVAADASGRTPPATVYAATGSACAQELGVTSVGADGSCVVTVGVGGTSASAPMWAGIVALTEQYAGGRLGFVNAGLYRIGEGAQYNQAFHDVTAGDNTVHQVDGSTVPGYPAAPGWDPVTGWGSPNAQALVPLLARSVQAGDGAGL